MKYILLTNDDGIEAEGLKSLRDVLRNIAHVIVVAPDRERSAVSHGLTIHERLQFQDAGTDSFSLNGTPADCVIFAMDQLLPEPPDLVISGINHGTNLGDDIMYSGTVAAAREAAKYGIPAIAVSQGFVDRKKIRFGEGIEFMRDMVKSMFDVGFNGELLLNVNFPIGKIRGTKITRHGCSDHIKHFNVPDKYHPPTGYVFDLNEELLTDKQAFLDGYVSITPLHRDQTDYDVVWAFGKGLWQSFGKR